MRYIIGETRYEIKDMKYKMWETRNEIQDMG